MGCFNKVGFYSHLPIKSEDKIVYFICASYGIFDDITPISVNNFIEPISLPLFGRYNEYGSIYQIEYNHYTEALENALEMDITDIILMIEDCSFMTLKDIEKIKENEQLRHNMKGYEKLLERMFERLSYFTKRKQDKISLCVTMEHRSVYDTICNMHKHLVTEFKYDFQQVKFPKIFEETLDCINEHNVKGVNIFSTNNSRYGNDLCELHITCSDYNEIAEKSKAIKEKYGEIEHIKYRFDLSNEFALTTLYCDFKLDMMLINILDLNYNMLKDMILDFTFFNYSLSVLCGTYGLSNYGSQSLVDKKDEFEALNECYKQIIDKMCKLHPPK